MTENYAIRLSGIGKCYRIYNRPEDRLKQMLVRGRRTYFREFDALRNIDLTVAKGQTVGLVGSNGSGKSTMLQIVCGTLAPTAGTCEVNGRISALLELGAGFSPDFSGRENIFLNAAILGLTREQTEEKYDDIVAFSGLDAHHLDQPVKTYSSGMYVRLAFAVAVAVQPDILVVDEALAVGDEAFQRKCFARIEDLKERGTTILFVSHAAQTIIELCDHAVLMDAGEILCQGAPKDIITGYHRLIFAAHDKRAAIRSDLQQGRLSAAVDEAQPLSVDENLRSESAIEYEKHGGSLSDVRMTDLNGKTVNILNTGERYRFCYRVSYTDTAYKPKYGMLIKTKRGVELGGAVAVELAEQGQDKAADSYTDVAFEFTCCLRPGHYFINCGTTKRERDEDIFVHRIVDALQFKVEEAGRTLHIEPAGNVDMRITCALTA